MCVLLVGLRRSFLWLGPVALQVARTQQPPAWPPTMSTRRRRVHSRVYVYDAIPPIITCPTSMNSPPNVVNGANLTFTVNGTDDSWYLVQNVQCVNNVCIPAWHQHTFVQCTAKDYANKTVSCGFTVSVSNAVPPSIVCPGNPVLTPTTGFPSAVASYSATASDPSGIFLNTCTPSSGTVCPSQ